MFEDLYLLSSKDASSDRLKVAEHRDIDDENQSIHFPRVKMEAVIHEFYTERAAYRYDIGHVRRFSVSLPQKKQACPIWYDTGIQQDWKGEEDERFTIIFENSYICKKHITSIRVI